MSIKTTLIKQGNNLVTFQVLKAASMKTAAFWVKRPSA
jgi:hypothetical protein